jgi:pimeloyl-ACP methyl ester carboxylesterase
MRGYPRNRLTQRPADEIVDTRTAMSRGYRISYDSAGSGPVVLLIPGATMSAGDWRDAGYVDVLARTHRVLSVDPLGLGMSDKPHHPDAYGWPEVATDLIAVLDAAGVDQAVVWGYSRGGPLAATLAVERPERVIGVILHEGGWADVPKGSPPSPYAEAMSRGDFSMLWDGGGFTFSEADRRYDEEFNDPRALGAMATGGRRSGFSLDPRRIAAPALVIEGSNDDLESAQRIASGLGLDVVVLPELDHLEAFSRLDLVMPPVLRFLESLGRARRPLTMQSAGGAIASAAMED